MAELVLPELVPCPPMSARLTEGSCIKRWTSAQGTEPPSWDSLRHCHTCPIGALRAGQTVSVATNAAIVSALNHYCPRCDRVASRLINGRTCVSCYNRTREAVLGRNAKGTRPRIADLIHAETMAISIGAGEPRLVTVDRVVSRAEAVVIAARQAGPGAMIGVPPLALTYHAGGKAGSAPEPSRPEAQPIPPSNPPGIEPHHAPLRTDPSHELQQSED